MSRRATTLVELAIAASLALLVLVAAWWVHAGGRRQADAAARITALLGEAVRVRARLGADVYAARVPKGVLRNRFFPQIEPEGRGVGFARSPPLDAGEDADEVFVRWVTEGPPDAATLVREVHGAEGLLERRAFRDATCRAARFERRVVDGEVFLVAELLLSPASADTPRVPLRLVRPLRPPRPIGFAFTEPFPAEVLGPPGGSPP